MYVHARLCCYVHVIIELYSRSNGDSLAAGGEDRDVGGARVLGCVVVGVVVRDIVGVVIVDGLLHTGCIRLTREGDIKS